MDVGMGMGLGVGEGESEGEGEDEDEDEDGSCLEGCVSRGRGLGLGLGMGMGMGSCFVAKWLSGIVGESRGRMIVGHLPLASRSRWDHWETGCKMLVGGGCWMLGVALLAVLLLFVLSSFVLLFFRLVPVCLVAVVVVVAVVAVVAVVVTVVWKQTRIIAFERGREWGRGVSLKGSLVD